MRDCIYKSRKWEQRGNKHCVLISTKLGINRGNGGRRGDNDGTPHHRSINLRDGES
jgi:hypothetical protein